MKNKENIVDLIKSLSKSEKRYFKLFVSNNSIGESSHYLKLFDLIEETGSAEKQTIQKLYGDDHFMKIGFRVYKNLLYKQILKSLRSYHSEGSVDDRVMELIRDSKILFERNLHQNAIKILAKAKSIAIKYEKNTLLLEVIQWEKKIIRALFGKTTEKQIIDLSKEEKLVVHKIDNAIEYWKVSTQMLHSYRINGVARTKEDVEKYNTIFRVPPLKKKELPLSYEAKKNYLFTHLLHFLTNNNLEGFYEYTKKIVHLMETYPEQIVDKPSNYSNALYNFIISTKSLNKYEEFFSMILKLKSLFKKFELPITHLIACNVIEFSGYIKIGQLKKAELLLTEIEAIINQQKDANEVFIINRTLFYFVTKKYHKALISLNEILNNENIYLSQEHYTFAKIFQLIIHFEKGNHDFLPYLIIAIYKFLLQKKKLFKFESLLIKFIRNRINIIKSEKEEKEAFKALHKELVIISADSMEARFLEHFDIISWLESKIENRSFGEILREKAGIQFEI